MTALHPSHDIDLLLADAHDALNATRYEEGQPWDDDLRTRVLCVQGRIRVALRLESNGTQPRDLGQTDTRTIFQQEAIVMTEKNLTVAEIQQAKDVMESEISAAVRAATDKFKETTGLFAEEVAVSMVRVDLVGSARPVYVVDRVRTKVTLLS